MTDWEYEQIRRICYSYINRYRRNYMVDFDDAVQTMLLHCIKFDHGKGDTPKERIGYLADLAFCGMGYYFKKIYCSKTNRHKFKSYAVGKRDKEELDVIAEKSSIEKGFELLEIQDLLDTLFNYCTPIQKFILLKHCEGYTYKEISGMVDLTECRCHSEYTMGLYNIRCALKRNPNYV